MEYILQHKVTLEDPKFFLKCTTELAQVDLGLQPIYNDVLKYRLKSQLLRSTFGELCIPVIIEHKAQVEDDASGLGEKLKVLKGALKKMDDIMFEKFVHPVDAKENISNKE